MSYRVIVTCEDGAWLADVPGLEGTHTWARNLPVLDRAVREAVVLGADLPDEAVDAVDLDYEYRTGDKLVDVAAESVRRHRRDVAEKERRVVESTEQLARDLTARGYSVRDVAVLTGVSYQRVSQLTRKAS